MVGAAAESLLSLSSFGSRSQSTKQQTFSSKMREKFSQQSCCQKPSAARSRVPVTHSCNSSPVPCRAMLQRQKLNVLNQQGGIRNAKKHLQGNFLSTGMNYTLSFSKMYLILLQCDSCCLLMSVRVFSSTCLSAMMWVK